MVTLEKALSKIKTPVLLQYSLKPGLMHLYKQSIEKLFDVQKKQTRNNNIILGVIGIGGTIGAFVVQDSIWFALLMAAIFIVPAVTVDLWLRNRNKKLSDKFNSSEITLFLTKDAMFTGYELFLFNPKTYLEKLSNSGYLVRVNKKTHCIQILKIQYQRRHEIIKIFKEIPYLPQDEEQVFQIVEGWQNYERVEYMREDLVEEFREKGAFY